MKPYLGLIGPCVLLVASSVALGQNFTDNLRDDRQTQREDTLSINFSNVSMTSEPEEASLFCGSFPGKSVWLTWQPLQSGLVDIQIVPTGFTPMIGIYLGKAFDELQRNTKLCSTTNRLVANVFAGETYRIAVAGLNNSGGDFTFNLTLVTLPKIVVQPADTDDTIGGSPQFTVLALGPDPQFPSIGGTTNPPSLQYQWRHAGANLVATNLVDGSTPDTTFPTGSTNAILSLNNVQDGWQGTVSVNVSNAYGTVPSRPAVLTLGLAPKILQHPTNQLLLRLAVGTARFNVSAIGKPVLRYQWQFKSNTPGSAFVDVRDDARISGATSTNLVVPAVAPSDEGKYRVVVSNDVGSATSLEATLTVDTPGLQITPLTSLTVGVGDRAAFSTTATVTSQATPKPTPTFQWFHGNDAIPGATTATYSIAKVALTDAGEYTVAVSIPGVTKTSSATLTVPVVPINDNFVNAIIIPYVNLVTTKGHNYGATPEAGERFHVGFAPARSVWWSWAVPLNCSLTTVYLSGNTLAGRVAVYQGASVSSLQDVRFKRDAADRLTFFSSTGPPYAIAVDGLNGAEGDITLNVVNNTDVPPPIIKRDCPDGIFLACDPCKFSVDVESIAPITFKWQRVDVIGAVTNFVDLDPVTHPTTVLTLSPTNSTPERLEMTIPSGQLTDQGYYRVVIANCGGVTNSRIAKLTLRLAPEIYIQPTDVLSKRECLSAQFDVAAKGCLPLFYQWRKNGVAIPNQTKNTLPFPSVSIDDIGDYSVVVANDLGATTSRVAKLTVDPLPHVTVHPQGKDVRSCVDYTFSVTADDTCNRPLSYQWQFKPNTTGSAFQNLIRAGTVATERELKLLNVQTNDTGDYRVSVTNIRGSTNSFQARLTVHAGPWITNALAQPSDQGKVKEGDSFTLKGSAESCSPLHYQWYFSGSGTQPTLPRWYPYTDANLSLFQTLVPVSSVAAQNIFIETNYVTNFPGFPPGTFTLTNYLVRTNPVTLTNLYFVPGATKPLLTVNNATPLNSGYYLLTMTNDDRWTNSRLTRVTVYTPPPNDDYENRAPIPGTNAFATGRNIFSTPQPIDPLTAASNRYPNSVWWTWKAPPDPGFFSLEFTNSFRSFVALCTNSPTDNSLVKFAEAGGPQVSGPFKLLRMGLTDLTTVQIAVNGVTNVINGITNDQGNIQFKLTYEVDPGCPRITRQPESVAVLKGANVTFSIDYGNPYVGYQWWFAADRRPSSTNLVPADVTLTPIPGASGAAYAQANATTNKVTLSLTNVTEAYEGYYVVVLTNKCGVPIRSEAARLTIGGIVRGMVTDATTGVGIPFAQVCGGDPSNRIDNFICTLTDTNGNYELFGVKPGTLKAVFQADKLVIGLNKPVSITDESTAKAILMTGKKAGYYDYENRQVRLLEGGAIRHDFAMSPILLQGMRFVLNWGNPPPDGVAPPDMDSILVTPFIINNKPIEVSPGSTGAVSSIPFATHDFDVRNGRGPETITLHRFTNGTYQMLAQKARQNDAGTLATSQGVVNIYTNRPSGSLEQQALFTIHAPATGDGLFWYICNIDGATHQVTIVNRYVTNTTLLLGSGTAEPNLPPRPAPPKEIISLLHDWDLDDGMTSSEISPTAAYAKPGFKTIGLKLTDPGQTPPLVNQLIRTNYILVTNDPPRITIDYPAPDQRFHVGTNIPIKVTATDTDSLLAGLRLLVQGNPVPFTTNVVNGSNWVATSIWPAITIGSFTVTAGVEDIFGLTNAAGPLTFHISNTPPEIKIVAPADGTVFRLGTTNDVVAETADDDSPLQSVEFFVDGKSFSIVKPGATNLLRWTAATRFPASSIGTFTLTAKVTDAFGGTGMSAPVTVRVRDLKGDILIIQNRLLDTNRPVSEISRMVELISAIPYTDPATGFKRPLETQLLDQAGLRYDLVDAFKLIIWDDLGESGLLDNTVSVLNQAYANGQPLYFVGQHLAGATASLNPVERDHWRNLVQLIPTGKSSGTNVVELTTLSPPHRIFPAPWPTESQTIRLLSEVEGAVLATNRVALLPPGLVTCGEPLQNTGRTEVMGRSGTSDALIFSPSQYFPDYGGVRTVTQSFLATDGADDVSLRVRGALFQYAVCWLLRYAPCSSINLELTSELSSRQVRAGEPFSYTLNLRAQGPCETDGVFVTNSLPASLCFQGIEECSAGAWKYENGLLTYFPGHLVNGDAGAIKLKINVIPKTSGMVSVVAGVSPNGPEVNAANNETRFEIEVLDGPPADCPASQKPELGAVLLSGASLELIARSLTVARGYTLEVSANLLNWTSLTNFTATTQTQSVLQPIQPSSGAKFYRLRSP